MVFSSRHPAEDLNTFISKAVSDQTKMLPKQQNDHQGQNNWIVFHDNNFSKGCLRKPHPICYWFIYTGKFIQFYQKAFHF